MKQKEEEETSHKEGRLSQQQQIKKEIQLL